MKDYGENSCCNENNNVLTIMAKSMHMYQIATKIKAGQSLKVPHRQTALIAAKNERRARRVRRPRDRANILMRHGQPSATYDTMASTPGVG